MLVLDRLRPTIPILSSSPGGAPPPSGWGGCSTGWAPGRLRLRSPIRTGTKDLDLGEGTGPPGARPLRTGPRGPRLGCNPLRPAQKGASTRDRWDRAPGKPSSACGAPSSVFGRPSSAFGTATSACAPGSPAPREGVPAPSARGGSALGPALPAVGRGVSATGNGIPSLRQGVLEPTPGGGLPPEGGGQSSQRWVSAFGTGVSALRTGFPHIGEGGPPPDTLRAPSGKRVSGAQKKERGPQRRGATVGTLAPPLKKGGGFCGDMTRFGLLNRDRVPRQNPGGF